MWIGLDPLLYDVVINLDEVSLSTACQMVCDAALSPEFQGKLSAIEKEIEDTILAAEVRAAIAASRSVGDRRVSKSRRTTVWWCWGVPWRPSKKRIGCECWRGLSPACRIWIPE